MIAGVEGVLATLTGPLFWQMATIFFGTAVIMWVLIRQVVDRFAVRRRLMRLASHEQPSSGLATDPSWVVGLGQAIGPLAALAMPSDEPTASSLSRALVQAGWRGAYAARLFVVSRVVLAIGIPAVALFVLMLSKGVHQGTTVDAWWSVLVVAAAAVGYLAPVGLCRLMIARRQQSIFEAFPDALDLMLICVESGLAIDAAIQRVANEVRLRSATLADELGLLSAEMRAGSPRDEALRRFSNRIGLPELNSFVSLIIQAERFGTSVGSALRVQSESLRSTRRLRAEERAAKVPVKLLFPLVFCIFPALFIVLMGPAAIRVWRVVLPAVQSAS